jgi:hypothetical protein
MRDRILTALPPVTHRRFLVYVMGPYKSFSDAERAQDAEGDGAKSEVLELLEAVRDSLREEASLNAFLATDVGIPLSELDAATQSIEFARASNVVAFVVPHLGRNLGVGIEVGSILEALAAEDRERIVFVHEDGVRSAMIAALAERWDATVYSYDSTEELVKRLREFSVDVMHREQYGDLPER